MMGEFVGGGAGKNNCLSEDRLRINFTSVLEILDEVMDDGLVWSTDAKAVAAQLRCKPTLPSADQKAASTTTAPQPSQSSVAALPWRPVGIKHSRNEVFLDVIERLNIQVHQCNAVSHHPHPFEVSLVLYVCVFAVGRCKGTVAGLQPGWMHSGKVGAFGDARIKAWLGRSNSLRGARCHK